MSDRMGKYLVRGTAKRIAKRAIRLKAASVLALSAVSIMTIAYGLVSLVNNSGDFTVNIQDRTLLRKSIDLSSTPGFEDPTTVLKADKIDSMTNISYEWIPEDIGNVDGGANGKNYICFTFYLKNVGEIRVNYNTEVNVISSSKGADEAMRFMLIKTVNGVAERKCYAKPKLGTEDEPEFWYYRYLSGGKQEEVTTTNFATSYQIINEEYIDFLVGEIHKFTIVIWLEGDDPECVDNIKKGQVKLGMKFDINQSQDEV